MIHQKLGSAEKSFDVIVIGAGHAGCEAALAAARLGARVAVVTLRLDGIGQMSCNPAIGGVAKGHLVREIDALGGAMARVADATGIQYRRLNLSRGAAVRSTRAQSDASLYKQAMAETLRAEPLITLIADEVIDLSWQTTGIDAVMTRDHGLIKAPTVIVTTGTFLNGLCHVGAEQFAGGRNGDAPANFLSTALSRLGLTLDRFKTGTTPRLQRDSIDYHRLEAQHGDIPRPTFSFDAVVNTLPQIPCHMTFTNAATHELVRESLHRSPLYTGTIQGSGPRYCPSLEDKIVRFSDKERHQIFLEPEGLNSQRVYPNGLSTSLPKDVQERFIRSIAGLERSVIVQYGYAVEYDYVPPTQLLPTLMTKALPGLFLAGQINGTSGYEEAAAQGLMAGINAARWLRGETPAVLARHQAYIGVLIDDLVTKGVDEPYRLFTSRAEHRLTLREANAEERLAPIATEWGLLSADRKRQFAERQAQRQALSALLETTSISTSLAAELGLPEAARGETLATALRRPEIVMANLSLASTYDAATQRLVEEELKYAGYIKREQREIARLGELERLRLPLNANYDRASGLSNEIREKLQAIRPLTLGQASRIPGMTPTAMALLRVHLHRWTTGPSQTAP